MQYDIAAKVIVEMGKETLLRHFLYIDPLSATLIEELPQETVSLRRSDFPLRVQDRNGEERIVLLEFQARWTVDIIWRMIEYSARFKQKYRLPIMPAMLLFRRHTKARDIYRDECFEFRFRLVKLWEQSAREVLERFEWPLMPFVPVMNSSEEEIFVAERTLYDSDLPRSQKADLLTALTIFGGMRDPSLATDLLRRRRDIMIESPTYELIKKEGIQEGKKEGEIQGIKKVLSDFIEMRFGREGQDVIGRIGQIRTSRDITPVERAVIEGKSLEEIRKILES